MTTYERRRHHRVLALQRAEPTIAGAYQRQNRYDFAESRKREGWSERLVDQAVSAGSLASVRRAIQEVVPDPPKPLAQAMRALGILDAGRRVETVYPHYGDDTLPLQRRTYAPPRLREI